MTELFSIRDAAKIFAIQESRLRYWTQTGFVGPTVRKGGRFYYTFTDLIAVKAVRDLLAAGLTVPAVRKNLASLRDVLPRDTRPESRLRICSDGETVVAIADDVAFEPRTRQVVMAFAVPGLADQIAEVMALAPSAPKCEAVPAPVDDDPTDAHTELTAYRCFLEACTAEDRGELERAEHLYRQALELQPSLAAAQTNLGNLCHRRGDPAAARTLYEQALDHEPTQAEARYNLGNVLDDLGETELAIAELRRVTLVAPDFADAHFNLGLLLARVGGHAQARVHLSRYVDLDADSPWSSQARAYLVTLAA